MARFTPPIKRVAHERIENEVIAIDLTTGTYYSMVDSTADVWTLLSAGLDLDETSTVLAERFAADAAAIVDELRRFVDELIEAGLLVPLDSGGEGSADLGVTDVELPAPESPYAPPRLERYDDMEALLLLDPIHEVDDAGWPIVAIEPQ